MKALFITCDPKRDGPEEMKSLLDRLSSRYYWTYRWRERNYGSGKEFRVYFSVNQTSTDQNDYLVDHSTVIYLMDKNGNFVKHFGKTTTIEECVNK